MHLSAAMRNVAKQDSAQVPGRLYVIAERTHLRKYYGKKKAGGI